MLCGSVTNKPLCVLVLTSLKDEVTEIWLDLCGSDRDLCLEKQKEAMTRREQNPSTDLVLTS